MFPAIKKCSIQSPSDRGDQRHIFQFIKIESKRSNVEFEYVAHKGLYTTVVGTPSVHLRVYAVSITKSRLRQKKSII